MPRHPHSRILTAGAAAGSLLAFLAATVGPSARASHPLPNPQVELPPAAGVGGCRVFPRNNYWNADISRLEVDSRSDAWMSHMSPDSFLHPDFGRNGHRFPYGIPITVVDETHAKVTVTFKYDHESDHVPYPLGSDTRIEGGRGSDGDRHAIIVDSSTCRLYETFATRTHDVEWFAGSGATWDLHSNDLRHDGWTSADAAGLAILPGLLRYDEVERLGLVRHAIRFTTDQTRTRHIWPARHDAGSTSSPDYPPMGARFRLKADFPTDGYRPDTTAVLLAMQTYGLVLADNGSPWFFQGSADRRWPGALLDELKSIPASAFEAVHTKPLQLRRGSGATR